MRCDNKLASSSGITCSELHLHARWDVLVYHMAYGTSRPPNITQGGYEDLLCAFLLGRHGLHVQNKHLRIQIVLRKAASVTRRLQRE